MIANEPPAPETAARRDVLAPAGGGRARRLYLVHRRHELLAPVHALLEFCGMLLEEEKIHCSPRIHDDLRTVEASARRLAKMIDDVLGPARVGGDGPLPDTVAQALNHDLRSLLTIILGYADELRRGLRNMFLDDYAAEVDKIRSLGRRALALVDSTVTQLRSPDGDMALDDVQTYLDRLVGDVDATARDDADDLEPAAEPGRLLVAEDNTAIRDLLCDLLRRQGHEVVAAGDGIDALLAIHARPFDLLLTDIEMPRVNGFQVIEHLKDDPELREIPVIVISGHGELDGIAHCLKMGAEDYLPKPFNRTILKARVDACLEKKRLRDRNEQQRRRFDELLHAILPGKVVAELAATNVVRPQRHEDIAVLFADIVGFTAYCDRHQDQPEVIVHYLQQLFEIWEEIASGFGVQKIKTIGDAFMAAAGLLEDAEDAVLDCVRCGLRMIEATQQLRDDQGQCLGWNLRVGIHAGPVVAGVLGRRQYLYDLWGDTVNTASRLESHGKPGCVNLSTSAWRRVASHFQGELHGSVEVKGKGMMELIHLNAAVIPAP
ncbi:MAG: response regulator [Singulisphaera sp.]|nr:response regulator [Singulisphaera sp.]